MSTEVDLIPENRPLTFRYLRQGNERKPSDVIEGNYYLKDLVKLPVIHDTFHRLYRIFPNWDTLESL